MASVQPFSDVPFVEVLPDGEIYLVERFARSPMEVVVCALSNPRKLVKPQRIAFEPRPLHDSIVAAAALAISRTLTGKRGWESQQENEVIGALSARLFRGCAAEADSCLW